MINQEIKQLERINAAYETSKDLVCQNALIKIFAAWAVAFPKRNLTVTHGMGIYSFHTEGLDLESLIAWDRHHFLKWRKRHDAILQPIIDYTQLFHDALGAPPCPSDFKYSAITKTIEYDGKCIHVPTGKKV